MHTSILIPVHTTPHQGHKTQMIVFPTNAAPIGHPQKLSCPRERGKPFCQQAGKDRPLPGHMPSKTQRFPEPNNLLDRDVPHTGPGPWSPIKKGCQGPYKHKESEAFIHSLGSQLAPRSVAPSPQASNHVPTTQGITQAKQAANLPTKTRPTQATRQLTSSDGYPTI